MMNAALKNPVLPDAACPVCCDVPPRWYVYGDPVRYEGKPVLLVFLGEYRWLRLARMVAWWHTICEIGNGHRVVDHPLKPDRSRARG